MAVVTETTNTARKNRSNAHLTRSMKSSLAIEPTKPDQRRLVESQNAEKPNITSLSTPTLQDAYTNIEEDLRLAWKS